MKKVMTLLCLMPLTAVSAGIAFADDDVEVRPLQTSRCLIQGTFDCVLAEVVYGVKGVTCVEDCLAVSNLNTCRLHNLCRWDAASGCFIKSVCIDISPLKSCRRWEHQAVCD